MSHDEFSSPEAPSANQPEMARRAPRRKDAGIRWVRNEHHVAARISPSDLKGRLSSGLEIQPGTRALLFVGGRYIGTLPPGRHTIESLTKKLKFTTEGEPVAIVIDDGELSLEFEVDGLHSADHHNASLFAQASLRMAEPEVFLANLMRDHSVFSVADLAEFLSEEIRVSLRDLVAGHSSEELHRGRVGAAIEMELLSSWKDTLDRTGFVLNRFRVLRFEFPGLEEAEDIRSETGDTITVGEAGRESRVAYFEAELADFNLSTMMFDRKEEAIETRRRLEVEHEIERTTIETERLEKRQPVYERFLKGGVLEKMARLKSDEEWRRFRLQVDREQLLDEAAWEKLRKDTEAEAEQEEVKRHQLLLRIKAMAAADLEELQLTRAYQLKILEMKGDRDVIAEQLEQERLQLENQLENRRMVFDADMEEQDRKLELGLKGQKAEAELEIWQIERMETIHQMGKDRDAARQLELKVREAEAERKKLAVIGDVMLGKSEDEILATAIALNPEKAVEIAAAFEAKSSGKMGQRERDLYDRMIGEIKDVQTRAQELDHEKFRIQAETAQELRQDGRELDEREKDRSERIAEAGLTGSREYQGAWQICPVHGIKYREGSRCPLCVQAVD